MFTMKRNGKKKGKKRKGGIPDTTKLPGTIAGSKASQDLSKDEEDHSSDVEDFLISIYGPSLKKDLKASAFSLRKDVNTEMMENHFRDKDIIFMASKISDEFADFMGNRERMDAMDLVVWIGNIEHVFDEYIGPYDSRMKGAIDKASYDQYESDIRGQLQWAEDLVNEESQSCQAGEVDAG